MTMIFPHFGAVYHFNTTAMPEMNKHYPEGDWIPLASFNDIR